MAYECNWQREKNGKWQSKTWTGPDALKEAKAAAELWANLGAWNANWQATNPGQDNRPAWTCRDGKRK